LRLRLASPIQRDGERDRCQSGEDIVLVAEVLVVGERSWGELEVGVGVDGLRVAGVHLRQPRRLLDRQRVKEDRVDDRKNRGIRANAQRQREHGYAGEARALLQHPQPAPQILLEVSSHHDTPTKRIGRPGRMNVSVKRTD